MASSAGDDRLPEVVELDSTQMLTSMLQMLKPGIVSAGLTKALCGVPVPENRLYVLSASSEGLSAGIVSAAERVTSPTVPDDAVTRVTAVVAPWRVPEEALPQQSERADWERARYGTDQFGRNMDNALVRSQRLPAGWPLLHLS